MPRTIRTPAAARSQVRPGALRFALSLAQARLPCGPCRVMFSPSIPRSGMALCKQISIPLKASFASQSFWSLGKAAKVLSSRCSCT